MSDPMTRVPSHPDPRPTGTARRAACVDDFAPSLILPGEHELCPGLRRAHRHALRGGDHRRARPDLAHRSRCSASAATRLLADTRRRGAPGAARARALAGHRRQAMPPDSIVFTVQGDGDMVNEGLQEVIHTAARGENITCLMLNNGVFGETGGHMTATTVLGQRTKNTLEGRDAADHGYPIQIARHPRRHRGHRLRGARGHQLGRARSHACAASSAARSRCRPQGSGSPSSRSSPCAPPDGSSTPRRARVPHGQPRPGPQGRRAQGRRRPA